MMRIGHGYDVHRLCAGRKMIIGGVNFGCDIGLLGHSDADVLTHAIMDALLGAAALGDIGVHFPDTDMKYKDANSLELLRCVVKKVEDAGYIICNLDCTIIAQEPKMRPFISQMIECIASSIGIESSRINIKATTEEGLGFTGAKEGISAHCIVLLESKPSE